jgi:hypothetical protein
MSGSINGFITPDKASDMNNRDLESSTQLHPNPMHFFAHSREECMCSEATQTTGIRPHSPVDFVGKQIILGSGMSLQRDVDANRLLSSIFLRGKPAPEHHPCDGHHKPVYI